VANKITFYDVVWVWIQNQDGGTESG
jgi:hypothetical protein